MSASRPAVHPVEAPPMTEAAEIPVRARMKDMQGSPGTIGGLILRLLQFFFAVAAISVMATTNDFVSVTAFRFLVAATGLQSLWSLSLAFVDVYALLVMRSLRNPRVMCLFFFRRWDNLDSDISSSMFICWHYCSNWQRSWHV